MSQYTRNKANRESQVRKRIFQVVGVFLALIFFLLAGIFSLGSTPNNADITEEMHDPELQSMYFPGRIIASLMSKEWGVNMFNRMTSSAATGDIEGFQSEERYIESSEGHEIRIRIFKPQNAEQKLPAMLYTHGGGYLSGFPEQALKIIQDFMQTRDVVVIAPAYRLSVEHPFPAGFNDCYETLLWIKENSDELGIYDDKYILAGRSAGGGMAAALALKARDTKDVNIAFQMPLFPMIDYRQETESAKMTGAIIWDNESNKHGWYQYLKGLNDKEVPAYASPAIAKDFSGLPPTITHVGSVEPFRDETINYIEALKAAGVPTKFKLFEGAYHGFNNLSPETEIGRAGDKFQFEAFADYYDSYVVNPSNLESVGSEAQIDSVESN
ncbi:MAG: alpha/beta hydrolase [Cyclobacteriaceae bacterium]